HGPIHVRDLIDYIVCRIDRCVQSLPHVRGPWVDGLDLMGCEGLIFWINCRMSYMHSRKFRYDQGGLTIGKRTGHGPICSDYGSIRIRLRVEKLIFCDLPQWVFV